MQLRPTVVPLAFAARAVPPMDLSTTTVSERPDDTGLPIVKGHLLSAP